MKCKICGQPSQRQFTATVLGKHEVAFYACPSCGFGQTEEPTWLAEAYQYPIHPADVGLVARNLHVANFLTILLRIFFDGAGKFLDCGAGTGLLVRLMRDQGFDFRWADKYAANQFAQGHEYVAGDRYEALTAFEVFEHQVSPQEELVEMAALTDNIIFSTELLPQPVPAANDWAYYSLTTGQHVAFHSRRSLALLAGSVGMKYQPIADSMHLFSRRPPPAFWMKALAMSKLSSLVLPFCRRPSLLVPDYEAMIASVAQRQSSPPSAP